MAKKKEAETNERAVDLEALEPALQEAARAVGFKKRVSINKVARTLEAELRYAKIGVIGTAVLVLAAAGFMLASYVGPDKVQVNARNVGLFAAIWALIGVIYTWHAKGQVRKLEAVDAAVKQRLGA